jgi:hypothetical protein
LSKEKAVRLQSSLRAVSTFTSPQQFDDVRKHIDPVWVAQALEATGTATVRRRRLPAEKVVSLVIGMAMFRKWPICDLVGKLNLVLPGPKATVAPSAVAEARGRVGAGPLEQIFTATTMSRGPDFPLTPLGGLLGRTRPTLGMLGAVALIVSCYIAAAELLKRVFFRHLGGTSEGPGAGLQPRPVTPRADAPAPPAPAAANAAPPPPPRSP